MPGHDGTGPQGRGPLTGRGLGNCQGAGSRQGFGRGFGQGRGFGGGFGRGGMARGQGFGFSAPAYQEPTKEEEKTYLESELKAAEEDIKAIKKRLSELK